MSSKNWAHENYLANGPGASSEIELNHIEAMQAPLLDHRTIGLNHEALQSARSLTPSINGPPRSHSPSPLYVSTDHPNHSPMDPSPGYHQRHSSGNLLASHQIRSPSPGPQAAMSQYQYPPQPHSRQSSGNPLLQSQSPQQSPQHIRQISENMLGQGGRQSPGPYQSYTGRHSPGPYQSYSPHQSPQHARQMSGNVLSGTPPPSYIPPPPGLQSTQQHYHQHQQSMSSSGHSNTAGRGPHGGY